MKLQNSDGNLQTAIEEVIKSQLSQKGFRRAELKKAVQTEFEKKHNKQLVGSTYHLVLRNLYKKGTIEKRAGEYTLKPLLLIKPERVTIFLTQLDASYKEKALEIIFGWYQTKRLSPEDSMRVEKKLLGILNKAKKPDELKYFVRVLTKFLDKLDNKTIAALLSKIESDWEEKEIDRYGYIQFLRKALLLGKIKKEKEIEEMFIPFVLEKGITQSEDAYNIIDYFKEKLKLVGENYIGTLIEQRNSTKNETLKQGYDFIIKQLAEA